MTYAGKMPLIRVLNYGLMEPFTEKTDPQNVYTDCPLTLAIDPFML
jgi:hypothetical protein